MFDKLVDALLQFAEYFKVCTIVYAWEQGVHLRLGRLFRTVGPGLCWQLPLLDHVMTTNVVANTSNLGAQSVTTLDGKPAVVSAIVTWKVSDVQKFLLEVEGAAEAVHDLAYGAIAEWIMAHPWDELRRKDASARMTGLVRRRSAEYGIEIVRVQLSDVTQCRSFRLWNAAS